MISNTDDLELKQQAWEDRAEESEEGDEGEDDGDYEAGDEGEEEVSAAVEGLGSFHISTADRAEAAWLSQDIHVPVVSLRSTVPFSA